VGWGFVSHLADRYDLDVIVEEEKFRAEIERWQAENPQHPAALIHFHFIPKKRNRFLRKIWPPSYYWYYRRWHCQAAQLARELDQVRDFDLLHQLTMVGYREPGYLWQQEKPFVWGPIGGAGFFPWRFLGSVGLYGAAYYLAYNFYNMVQLRLLGRARRAAARAGKGLIAATGENLDAARRYWRCDGYVLSEVGCSGKGGSRITRRESGEPLRILWSGRHTPGKGLNLALAALAELPESVDWELHVLGQGRLTDKWQAQAGQLGITGRCCFHGWVARDEALALAAGSHVALITSLRDLTSTVTIEAMEMGLPVIAPDHCGFADAINEDCGILVPVSRPKSLIKGFAQAVAHLEGDEMLRRRLALGALARAKKYSWSNKVERLASIYEVRLAECEVPKRKVV